MKYRKATYFKSFIAFVLLAATVPAVYYFSLRYYRNVAYFDEDGQLIYNGKVYLRVDSGKNFEVTEPIGEIKSDIGTALLGNILVCRVAVDGEERSDVI